MLAGAVSGLVAADAPRLTSAANQQEKRPWVAKSIATFKGHTVKVQSAALSPDGRLAALYRADASDTGWRYVDFASGAAHQLRAIDASTFQSSAGWSGSMPAEWRYTMGRSATGAATLAVRAPGATLRVGARVALVEDTVHFMSGDVSLFGKLIRPAGAGPWPVLVFVHGSDATPSVDRLWDPYFFAAHGVAMFVFDKRGTGRSGGQYLQLFSTLSDDVVAATRLLPARADVDSTHIGLAGFSQGGWVAPLAARKDPGVRFVLVGYGMAMSVSEEDRLEAPLKLRERGFGEQDIREFEELNALIHRTAEHKFADGWGEIESKLTQYRDRRWLAELPQMETWAGSMLKMGLAQAKVVVPKMFETFIDPFYDPVPTLEALDIPMLWLLGGDDIEAPPGPTIEVLARLERSGKPVTTRIFPGADHGIIEFELRDGRRVRTRYAPGYFDAMAEWVARQVRR